ncbi:MAG: hypothetical protein EOM62_11020 [Bacteroidia bacterium]|nr:hypothetical protein [Bacteroidia bacterium]
MSKNEVVREDNLVSKLLENLGAETPKIQEVVEVANLEVTTVPVTTGVEDPVITHTEEVEVSQLLGEIKKAIDAGAVKEVEAINYSAIGSLGAFYQRLKEAILQLLKFGKLDKEQAAKMLTVVDTSFHYDCDAALDKKEGAAVWLVKSEVVNTFGEASRFDNPRGVKAAIYKELATPETEREVALRDVIMEVANLVEKFGLKCQTSYRHLGRARKDIEKDKLERLYLPAMERMVKEWVKGKPEAIYNAPDFTPDEANLEEVDEEEQVGVMQMVGYVALPIDTGEGKRTPDWDPEGKLLVSRQLLVKAVEAGVIDRAALATLRTRVGIQFSKLVDRMVSVAKSGFSFSVEKTLSIYASQHGLPMPIWAVNYKGAIDFIHFSSPNRKGSKWLMTAKLVDLDGDLYAEDCFFLSPMLAVGNKNRFNFYNLVSCDLRDDLQMPEALLSFVGPRGGVVTEKGLNQVWTAYVGKNVDHPAFHPISFKGDGKMATDKALGYFHKNQEAGKDKGMASYIGEGFYVKLSNGRKIGVSLIGNTQGKRRNQLEVIGAAALRGIKVLRGKQEPFSCTDEEAMARIGYAAMKEMSGVLYRGSTPICQCILGVSNFAIDTTQNYHARVSRLTLKDMQALGTLDSNWVRGEKFSSKNYFAFGMTHEDKCVAYYGYAQAKAMAALTLPTREEMKAISIRKPSAVQVKQSGYAWNTTFLIAEGLAGKGLAEVIVTLFNQELGAEAKARRIFDIASKGFEVKLPGLQGFMFQTHKPVFLDSEGQPTLSGVLQELKTFVSRYLRTILEGTTEEGYEAAKKAYSRVWHLALAQATEAGLKRGQAIGARTLTGHEGLEHVLVPGKAFFDFYGYAKNGNLLVKMASDELLELRRLQDPDLAKVVDDAVAAAEGDIRQVVEKVNAYLEASGKEALLVRHPIIGFIPTTTFRVALGIQGMVIPQTLCARYTGLNCDDDADLGYLAPYAG